jgi:putative acetyltransferase
MIAVRAERVQDIEAIRRINHLAFGQPGEAAAIEALRSRGAISFSLVACVGDEVAGHVLFSPMTVAGGSQGMRAVGLGPIAVLPEFQRQGIGSRLIEEGLRRCRDAGFDCVFVLGHSEYYPRFGFVPASRHGIRCAYDVPDEAFMVKELRSGALAGASGIAIYQPEFNGL